MELSDNVTVTLSEPIKTLRADGLVEIGELSIRPPIGDDILAAGYPFRPGVGFMDIDVDCMAVLIARCANITSSAVGALALGDWNACMGAVLSSWQVRPEQATEGVVTLSQPVTLADGTQAGEITLRPAKGRDLAAVGYPIGMAGAATSRIDVKRMAALIALLAGIPPEAVGAMPAGDWNLCMRSVQDFFEQRLRKP